MLLAALENAETIDLAEARTKRQYSCEAGL